MIWEKSTLYILKEQRTTYPHFYYTCYHIFIYLTKEQLTTQGPIFLFYLLPFVDKFPESFVFKYLAFVVTTLLFLIIDIIGGSVKFFFSFFFANKKKKYLDPLFSLCSENICTLPFLYKHFIARDWLV